MTAALHQSESREVDRMCAEGLELIDARRFAEARTLLEQARAIAPGSGKVHYYLAVLFSDMGLHDETLASLDALLRVEGDNAKAHNNRGSVLQVTGRLAEAELAFRRSVELRPDLAPPYSNLGKLMEQQGRMAEAVAVYDQALARGLDVDVFRQYRAAAVGERTPRSPDEWVRATFDNFAPTFDAHLEALRYNVPGDLAALLGRHARNSLEILDLGCGTGLVGLALAGDGHRVTGVDLSEKMLGQARARGAYAALHRTEIHAFLTQAPLGSFDAVVAADVFIYIGDLAAVFREAARVLRAGGWFAFSTEECAEPDFTLLPTGRYAQARAYIDRLSRGDFATMDATPSTIRMEQGTPLRGRLYLLQRR